MVNSCTSLIRGVKDPQGVENVGKWHETVHGVDDIGVLRPNGTLPLPGLLVPNSITCYRSGTIQLSSEARAREFWAEEAGRAAAVCHRSLAKSEAFQELRRLRGLQFGEGWRLLYRAAKDIGVNGSALAKQLELEGWIVLDKVEGRNCLHILSAMTGFAAEVA